MTKRRSSRKRSSRSKKKREPLIQLSRDQWFDLLGGLLVFLAVLTVLSLLSAQQGTLTELWLAGLSSLFGWGMYVVPIYIGAVGLWLLFRRFEDRFPTPDPEQIVGVVWGFLAALTTLHFIADRIIWREVATFALVEGGRGGGYVGAALLDVGIKALGPAGIVVALIMSWLTVVTFTASISPAEAVQRLSRYFRQRRERRAQRTTSTEKLKGETASQEPLILGDEPPEPASPKRAKQKPPREEPEMVINAPPPKEEEEEIDILIPSLPRSSPWRLPAVNDILELGSEQNYSFDLIRKQARIIEDTLVSLGAPGKVLETNTGPVITQFGVEPLFLTSRSGKKTKVKVSKITSLADDLALALSAKSIRIEAPIPGRGLVGIEVPNMEPSMVALRDVMESKAFARLKGTLRMGLGQDVSGQAVAADLRAMPHLLIAGTTGAGKSVCVNAIITAFLLQNSPDTLRILMVDPKRVELTQYNGIPHLLAPVIVDVERVVPALRWVMREMDGRYRRFAKIGARHIEDFNSRVSKMEDEEPIPYIVVVVDELADLMMQSPEETERVICRLAQMARATGIHLIISTQRPSVDVVTGLIKANFPARIAFAVASSVDSRVILDVPGAERLLGRGDMLFVPPDVSQPLRLQGTFVSNREIDRLIDYWRRTKEPGATLPEAAIPEPPTGLKEALVQPTLFPEFEEPSDRFEDELVPTAVEVLLAEDRASISLLQRRLRIGYTRSARIIDLLTDMGIVTEEVQKGQSRGVNRPVAEALLASLEKEDSST
ncbi:MAG: DNA translocase FtsK [Anaerolineae bacterium]